MMRFGSLLFFLVVAIAAVSIGAPCDAQVFPYSAPKAPEFDADGNYVPPGSRAEARTPSVPQAPEVRRRKPVRQAARPRAQAISRQPAQVQARPQAPASPGQTQAPMQRQAAYQGGAGAAVQPQAQPQQMDCSQYPMKIANARSEVEMRQIARYFLTCLMQNGWSQEQARKYVIDTIQSTYKVGRR